MSSNEVGNLLDSIEKFKGFKQLATYNINCLHKLITPPHEGWKENVEELVKRGGVEKLTSVLQTEKFQGDCDVLKVVTQTLGKMCTSKENAQKIAKAGALDAVLVSMKAASATAGEDEDSRENLGHAAVLLENMAKCDPDSIVHSEGVLEGILGVMQAHPSNVDLVATLNRTLLKVCKSQEAVDKLLSSGGISIILNTCKSVSSGQYSEESSKAVLPGLSILARLCKDEANIETLTQHGGVEALVQILDNFSGKDDVLRVGGKLLSKVASDQLEETLANLSSASPEQRERMLGLISHLALDGDNAENIMASGGIGSLISVFTADASAKSAESTSRALGRLANNAENVDKLIDSGAVEALISSMNNSADEAALAAAITPALMSLANSSVNLSKIEAAGGIDTVLRTLVAHPEFEEHTECAIKFLAKLSSIDYDIGLLVQKGGISAIVNGVMQNPDSKEIQNSGIKALMSIAERPEFMNQIIDEGGLDMLLSGLGGFSDDREMVTSCMSLLSSALLANPNIASKLSGDSSTIISALCEHLDDAKVKNVAKVVLEHLVTDKHVADQLQIVEVCVKNLNSGGEEGSLKLLDALKTLSAFSIAPSKLEMIVQNKGIDVFLNTTDKVAMAMECHAQDEIVAASVMTIQQCILNDPSKGDICTTCTQKRCVSKYASAVKMNPKMRATCLSVAHALGSISQQSSDANATVVKQGGIATCISALRAHKYDAEIIAASGDTLLRITASPDGLPEIIKQGGAAQIVSGVKHTLDDAKTMREPAEKLLRLLNMIGGIQAGKVKLVEAKCTDVVFSVMDAYPEDKVISGIASEILGKLMDSDGVISATQRIAAMANNYDNESPQKLKFAVTQIGNLAAVDDNVPIIVENGGVNSLVSLLSQVSAKAADDEVQADILNKVVTALGLISAKVNLDESSQAVPWILHVLRQTGTKECLMCVKNVALDSENASAIVANGGVELIIAQL
jgi:hypothetical protein